MTEEEEFTAHRKDEHRLAEQSEEEPVSLEQFAKELTSTSSLPNAVSSLPVASPSAKEESVLPPALGISTKASAQPLVDPLDLEVELSFSLGKKLVPLKEVKTLLEGKFLSLGGTDFQVSILLEKKVIAFAQLVLVEGVPSLQIIKSVTP